MLDGVRPIPKRFGSWVHEQKRHDHYVSLCTTHERLMAEGSKIYCDNPGHSDPDWTGGLTFPQQLARLANGAVDQVAEAEAMMRELEIDLEGYRRHLAPRPVGSSPRVGAYLAGDPCDMWGYEETEDTRGPVRIYVGLGSSAGIAPKAWTRRGVAALSLAMALSQVRPVELVACDGGKVGTHRIDTFVAVHIGLSPLDLSRACAYLCNVGVGRQVMYQLEGHVAGCDGGEASLNGWPTYTEGQMVRDHAAADGVQAIHLPSVFATESRAILADPRAWCEQTLRDALRGEGAAFTDYAAACAAGA